MGIVVHCTQLVSWMKQTARKSVGGTFPGRKLQNPGAVPKKKASVLSGSQVQNNQVPQQAASQGVPVALPEAGTISPSLWDSGRSFSEQLEEQKAVWRGKRAVVKAIGNVGHKRRKVMTGPKRACSSYLFWQSEVRSKFKEDNPDAAIGELAKLMGVAWGKLTPEDKHKYDQMAARDKERYQ